MRKFLILSLFLSYWSVSHAFQLQSNALVGDSTYIHSPKRAAIWSAFIPGAGQFYNELGYRKVADKKNRAWWKIPVIYGGLAACGYYFYHNNQYANLTKQEYQFRENNEGYLDQRFENYPNPNSLIQGYTANNITYNGFDTYANRRDLFVVGFIAVWGLNVMEAFVDGHFVTFDVSEDLSLSWHPTLIGNKHPGLGLTLQFN